MKILLVNPLMTFYSEENLNFPQITLGILYLAAIAENMGHEVVVKNVHSSNFKKLVKKMKPDLVGITCCTLQYNQSLKIAQITKEFNKKITTILGGHHPTFTWQRILNETDAFDYICVGEGEETFKEFLKSFRNPEKMKEIKGLAFKENGKPIFTGERELIFDLDSLPFPARHLVNFPVPVLITSRGCFNNCRFCTIKNFYKRTYRIRSVENTIEELILLKNKGHKKIIFQDDNFGMNKEYVLELCEAIKKSNFDDIEFELESDPKILFDDDILSALEQINVKTLDIGIQSILDKTRNYLNLFGDYEFIKKFFEKIKKRNFDVWCLFLVNGGEESENIQMIQENLYKFFSLMKESSNDKARISTVLFILIPYPGTDLEKDFVKRGVKMNFGDWSSYRFKYCIYEYNDVNEKSLLKIINKARKKFFSVRHSFGEIRRPALIRWVFSSDLGLALKLKIISTLFYLNFLKRKSIHQSLGFILKKYF